MITITITVIITTTITTTTTKQGVVDICVSMQETVFKLTQRFERELRRYYYVTPTSYLTLIGTFMGMVRKRRKVVQDDKGR